jgi:hypothetical protein
LTRPALPTPRPARSPPTPGTSATARPARRDRDAHLRHGGAKTITLVVTDNQGLPSAPATRTANPIIDGGGGGTGTQPKPGHNWLVPDRPRTNTPRISDGEIWDLEVVPQLNRVFIAGGFSGGANTTGTNTAFVNQPQLLSYNLTTGLIDTSFRPTFAAAA